MPTESTPNPNNNDAKIEALRATHAAALSERDTKIAELTQTLDDTNTAIAEMKKAAAKKDGDVETLMKLERDATAKARGDLDTANGKIKGLEGTVGGLERQVAEVRMSYSVASSVGLDATVVEPLLTTMKLEKLDRTSDNIESAAKAFKQKFPSLFEAKDLGPRSTPGGSSGGALDVKALAKGMSRGGRGVPS